MWRAFICRTMTGELLEELDMPSFSWSVTMGGSSLETKRDFSYGTDDVGGIELPWSAVRGTTKQQAALALATGRRAIVIGWEQDGVWRPIVFGAIGDRTDTWDGTSFELQGVWELLECRYLVTLDDYGRGFEPLEASGLSRRGLCAFAGRHVTGGLLGYGGELPVDWNYYCETGSESLDLSAGDLDSLTFADLLEDLMNSDIDNYDLVTRQADSCAPDATFVPKLVNGSVRLGFLCGTADDPQVAPGQSCALEDWTDMQVQHAQPYERVLALGKEQEDEDEDSDDDDEEEEDPTYDTGWGADYTLCTLDDPYPLRETTVDCGSDEDYDEDDGPGYCNKVAFALAAFRDCIPLAQVSLEVSAYQLPLGLVWPGDTCRVTVEGFPSLPDGTYDWRIMELQGDSTDRVTVTFYPFEDPMYEL